MLRSFITSLSAFVALFLSSSLFAHSDYKGETLSRLPKLVACHCKRIIKDGIYLGAGLGYDYYHYRQNVNAPTAGGGLDEAAATNNAGGMVGNIFLGYGNYFDLFYIAGEILVDYSGADRDYAFNQYRSTLSVNEGYGASIIPGVLVNDSTLLYARVGYMRTWFKLQEREIGVFNLPSTDWGNGLNLGIGIESAIFKNKNFNLRAEYTYTKYDAFKTKVGTTVSPYNNELLIGILYHFDYV